jgi:hypothetical protein
MAFSETLKLFRKKQTVSEKWKRFKASKNITIRKFLGIFGLRKPICNLKKPLKCSWDRLRNTVGIKMLWNPFFGFLECENLFRALSSVGCVNSLSCMNFICFSHFVNYLISLNSTRTLCRKNSLGSVSSWGSLGLLGFVNFCSNSWKSIDVCRGVASVRRLGGGTF